MCVVESINIRLYVHGEPCMTHMANQHCVVFGRARYVALATFGTAT